jgi:hypothetical protein
MPHPFHAYMRKQALVTPFSKPGMKDNTGRWLKAEEPIPDRVVEETNARRKNLPVPAKPAKPAPKLDAQLREIGQEPGKRSQMDLLKD